MYTRMKRQQYFIITVKLAKRVISLYIIKVYTLVTVITKYWLYSLCCTIHPSAYLTSNNLYLPHSHPHNAPPPPTGSHKTVLYIYETISLLYFAGLFFWIIHIYDIYYLSFSVWLISVSIMSSKSIYVTANGKIVFFSWLSSIPLCVSVCVCVYLSIYLPHHLCV